MLKYPIPGVSASVPEIALTADEDHELLITKRSSLTDFCLELLFVLLHILGIPGRIPNLAFSSSE
jgi:hypothetical protein